MANSSLIYRLMMSASWTLRSNVVPEEDERLQPQHSLPWYRGMHSMTTSSLHSARTLTPTRSASYTHFTISLPDISVQFTDEEHWGCPVRVVGLQPPLTVLVHTWSSLHPPFARKQDGRQKLSLVVLTVRQRELGGQGRAASAVQGPVMSRWE